MIKAIFLDIDGTVVSLKTGRYAESTRRAVQELRDRGILVFVATGRSKFEIFTEHLIDDFPFDGYLTNNGQVGYDGDFKLMFGEAIDPRDVQAIYAWLQENHQPFWMVSDTDSMLTNPTPRVDVVMKAIHTSYPEVGDLSHMLSQPIYKIVLYLNEEEAQPLLPLMHHSRLVRWHGLGCDVISERGGKRSAMYQTLARHGLKPEECLAMGDSQNDEEMLLGAGISVAMGNATPQLKAIADFVSTDCEDDGVVNALKHFGLL